MTIIIYILLWLNIISFICGYILSHILYNNSISPSFNPISNSFIKNNRIQNDLNINNNPKIEIDDKKVVVNIDTQGLEKKYEELGDTKISDININNSINKLKNLKG